MKLDRARKLPEGNTWRRLAVHAAIAGMACWSGTSTLPARVHAKALIDP